MERVESSRTRRTILSETVTGWPMRRRMDLGVGMVGSGGLSRCIFEAGLLRSVRAPVRIKCEGPGVPATRDLHGAIRAIGHLSG